jgi:hypothetical protein
MNKNILPMMLIIIMSNSINAAEPLETGCPDITDIVTQPSEIENIAESDQKKPLLNRLTEEIQLVREEFKKNERKIIGNCVTVGLSLLGIGGGVACIIDGHNKTVVAEAAYAYNNCLNIKSPTCDELSTDLGNAQIEMLLGGCFCFTVPVGIALGRIIGYFCFGRW